MRQQGKDWDRGTVPVISLLAKYMYNNHEKLKP